MLFWLILMFVSTVVVYTVIGFIEKKFSIGSVILVLSFLLFQIVFLSFISVYPNINKVFLKPQPFLLDCMGPCPAYEEYYYSFKEVIVNLVLTIICLLPLSLLGAFILHFFRSKLIGAIVLGTLNILWWVALYQVFGIRI